jgi:crotonobetainyl-CoA:carnitine CoA-transferase CaiB-like acyl-CoA transferase
MNPYRLPLTGVRVLDLTMVWAGPSGTRLLGDLGAEVIKVEAARSWDMLRSLHFLGSEVERGYDRSAFFHHNNRNKLACAIDLSVPKGRELALRLVAASDVVVENYRADVLDNLGLGYEALCAVKPDIILVSMPSHGKTGPQAHHLAYGTNIEQLAGLAAMTGYPDRGPHKTGISFGDPMAGAMAAAATLMALLHRRLTGEGQWIEVAQWENLIHHVGEFVVAASMGYASPGPHGNDHPSMAPHDVYPCKGDDSWVAIAVGSDAEFAALCEVIGRPELARDERFADVVSRWKRRQELDEPIAAWTRQRTHDEAAAALQEAGVDAAPVLTIPDLMDNPHLNARSFWETVAHDPAGVWRMEGPLWHFSRTPGHVRLPGPNFGEHNEYVFRALLGLSDAEIDQLRAEGVIADTPDLAVHA